MLKICDTYVIGVDIDEKIAESAVSIAKVEMSKRVLVKSFHGQDAIDFYNKFLKEKEAMYLVARRRCLMEMMSGYDSDTDINND